MEAVKQCGSPWLPAIEPPHTIPEVLQSGVNVELPLVAALQDGSRHPREYFASFQNTHGRKPKSVCVWIGPEGDFTPSEYAAIRAAGTQPITLGPLVLRTETAAIYCLSVLNYETSA